MILLGIFIKFKKTKVNEIDRRNFGSEEKTQKNDPDGFDEISEIAPQLIVMLKCFN